jgi:hypothetical protein
LCLEVFRWSFNGGVYTWRDRGPPRVDTTVMGFRATTYAVLILEASFQDLPVVFFGVLRIFFAPSTYVFGDTLFLTGLYWFSCRVQENWAAKYPWSEQDPDGDGTFDKVRCIICSKVNGRDKILDAKDDNLKKHQGWKRALTDLPSLKVKKREWYWD